MTRKLYTSIALAAMLTISSAFPAASQDTSVYLPLVTKQTASNPDPDIPVGGCKFNTIPTDDGDWEIWIEVTKGDPIGSHRTLDIYWTDDQGRLIHDAVVYVYSRTKFLTYQSQVSDDVIALIWEGEPHDSDYQTYCELVVNPSTAAQAATLLDFAQVHVLKDSEQSTTYEAFCAFYGDSELEVWYTATDAATGKSRRERWLTDIAAIYDLGTDCGRVITGDPYITLAKPEVITQVDFVSDGITTTRYSDDFFRFWIYNPFVAR